MIYLKEMCSMIYFYAFNQSNLSRVSNPFVYVQITYKNRREQKFITIWGIVSSTYRMNCWLDGNGGRDTSGM